MSTKDETAFTYAWEGTNNDFIHWLLPVLLVGRDDLRDDLAEKTEKWSKVTLTMQINGVEMPTEHLLKGIEMNMRHFAALEASRMVNELARFGDLQDLLSEVQTAVLQKVKREIGDAGIELPDEDGMYP